MRLLVLSPDHFPLIVHVSREHICMPWEIIWIQDRMVAWFVGTHLYNSVRTCRSHNGIQCHEVTYVHVFILYIHMYGRLLLMKPSRSKKPRMGCVLYSLFLACFSVLSIIIQCVVLLLLISHIYACTNERMHMHYAHAARMQYHVCNMPLYMCVQDAITDETVQQQGTQDGVSLCGLRNCSSVFFLHK